MRVPRGDNSGALSMPALLALLLLSNYKRLPDDSTRRIRTEKQRCPANLGWRREFCALPNGDAIDANIILSQFTSRLPGHGSQAGFPGQVANASGKGRIQSLGREQVDYRAAAFVRHHSRRQLHAKESAADIHLELPPPVPLINDQQRLSMKDFRAVDQNVKPAKGVARPFDEIGGLKAIGDIGMQSDGGAAPALYDLRDRISPFDVDITSRNRSAATSQSQRNCPPGSAACARHQSAASA